MVADLQHRGLIDADRKLTAAGHAYCDEQLRKLTTPSNRAYDKRP